MLRLHPRSCERAREWASLRMDGELSEFEQALLAAHLEGCAPCADFARSVGAVSRSLRKAEPMRLREPIALPRRRRSFGGLRATAGATAAAAVVAAIGLGTLIGSVGGTQPPLRGTSFPRDAVSSHPQGEQALIQEPKLALLRAKAGLGKQRGIGIADV
jgi:predicted anti-sigma-YlaC factor YlaD